MENHSHIPLFANVILPIPLRKLFTYRIPGELANDVSRGKRVIVQFGARRYYSAIVESLHNNPPEGYEVKEIISVLDDKPVVNDFQLEFWDWIASYYMCSKGDAMKAALPSGLKLESETQITINAEFVASEPLSASENHILDIIGSKQSLSVSDISKVYKKTDLLRVVKRLVDLGAVYIEESIRESYKPRTETYIEIPEAIRNDKDLKVFFDELKRAPKQLLVLMKYIQLSGVLTTHYEEVSKKVLLESTGAAPEALNNLLKRGVLKTYEKQKGLVTHMETEGQLKLLSDLQQRVLDQIKQIFADKAVILLHGYTASGKTEVYIHLIEEQIRAGKQVLYLLPEIALTAQIINRLKYAFGNKVGIYHSKFSDADRIKVWNGLMNDAEMQQYQVILGARSSVFLPFSNLGLIIVDEEHESSYKQYDPAPRYHARDAAIVLANKHNAKVLLGTATPSLESYFNAEQGKYGLVKLFSRYTNVALPEIKIVNIADARDRKKMQSHFHPDLIASMKEALDSGEQVILFQNRRGYSPYFQCTSCHAIPKCKYCDVSLTYHKHINLLVCHYCGFSSSKINTCPTCGSEAMIMHGFGTEKVEDELAIFFPGRRVSRMDVDTTRTRKSYEKIIYDFENHEVDILVGTQMISKGLDFDNVSLVGILDADHLINFPDFRAFERSYQLMSQVSGRAGRKNKQGKVIIQTTDPKHYVIHDVINHDFMHLYRTQVEERHYYGYPPFTRLIQLTLKHKDKTLLDKAADYFAAHLRKQLGERIIGPEYPLIGRISNWFQKTVWIKVERQASMIKAKEQIWQSIDDLNAHPDFRTVFVQPDVDPM
jgi:primosomal protein N' (replication factor Y) (superfamily II helicase)